MLVKLHIAQLKTNAQRRPEGYVDYVLTRGKVRGEYVELDVSALNDLHEKFPHPVVSQAPTGPGVVEMSANFTTAMTNWAKSGFKTVSRKVYNRRLAICLGCEHWDASARAGLGKCAICGCAKGKLWLASAHCPLKEAKW